MGNRKVFPFIAAERRIDHRALTGCSRSPLAISRTRHLELAAHPRHAEQVALLFDPGVLHRDSFAKYAAAFFTISRSSLVLASSRRNRAFSASTSWSDRYTLTAPPSATLPASLRFIQFHRLDSGMPNRLAALLPPIDSPSLTAKAYLLLCAALGSPAKLAHSLPENAAHRVQSTVAAPPCPRGG